MIFSPLKYYILKITNKKTIFHFNYVIDGHILASVGSNPYPGVELTNNMSWDKQVQKVVTKGNRALSHRNMPGRGKTPIISCFCETSPGICQNYMRSVLKKQVNQIEMTQRRATRFIKRNYSREPGTVTTLDPRAAGLTTIIHTLKIT